MKAQRDDCALCHADGLLVRGHRGVAFYALGHPVHEGQEWVEDLERRDGCWVDTDAVDAAQLVVVMVGDDEPHLIDVEEATVLAREAFCSSCGQVGCTHDGLERLAVVA